MHWQSGHEVPVVSQHNDRRPRLVADDSHALSMPEADALEPLQILVDSLMGAALGAWWLAAEVEAWCLDRLAARKGAA